MFSRSFNFLAITSGAFLKCAVLPFLFLVFVSSSWADWGASDSANLRDIRDYLHFDEGQIEHYLQSISAKAFSINSLLSVNGFVGDNIESSKYLLDHIDQTFNNFFNSTVTFRGRLLDILSSITNSPSPSFSITNEITVSPVITNSFTFNPVITNNFSIYPTFTNLIALSPVFTNNLDLSPLVNPLANISSNSTSSVDYLSAISDKLDQIILSNTNLVNVPLSLEIVTNLIEVLGLKTQPDTTYDNLDAQIDDAESLYKLLNLNPYWYSSIGFLWVQGADNLDKWPWWRGFYNKFYREMTLAQRNRLTQVFSRLRTEAENDNSQITFLNFAYDSQIMHEKLYGTYDIEHQLDWFTNKYSDAVTELIDFHNDFISFTNQFSSFTPPQYQEVSAEYSATTSLVSRLDPQFSDTGSVSGITENTNIVPLANSVLENASENQWTPNQADYDFSTFQQSVNGFLQQLNNGVSIGSTELSIHFKGWDNTQEQTITLDFALVNEGKAKVQALWHTIFPLCKIAICMWGLVSVIQALLSDGKAKEYHDILDGADIDK